MARPPPHYLQLSTSRVTAAGDRIRRVDSSRGHLVGLAGHLRLHAVEVDEVHALPDLARASDPQVLRDEDGTVVPAAKRCEHLVPLEQPVGDARQGYLRIYLDSRNEDLRVLLRLGPYGFVDTCDEAIEVTRVDGEASGSAVPAPIAHQMPYRKERAVEVYLGLPGAG